jgi:hypothetical protein
MKRVLKGGPIEEVGPPAIAVWGSGKILMVFDVEPRFAWKVPCALGLRESWMARAGMDQIGQYLIENLYRQCLEPALRSWLCLGGDACVKGRRYLKTSSERATEKLERREWHDSGIRHILGLLQSTAG